MLNISKRSERSGVRVFHLPDASFKTMLQQLKPPIGFQDSFFQEDHRLLNQHPFNFMNELGGKHKFKKCLE